jgi:hypothetical protein
MRNYVLIQKRDWEIQIRITISNNDGDEINTLFKMNHQLVATDFVGCKKWKSEVSFTPKPGCVEDFSTSIITKVKKIAKCYIYSTKQTPHDNNGLTVLHLPIFLCPSFVYSLGITCFY